MSRFSRCLIVGVVLTWVGLGTMLPAQAAPSVSLKVYQLPCSDSPCTSKDQPVGSNAVVSNDIEGQITASDSVELAWVELQARYGSSGSWTCLRHWDVSATSSKPSYDWDSTRWANGCPTNTKSGFTHNGGYQLRAVAEESVSGSQAGSSAFPVQLNNAPSIPQWASSPSVSGAAQGQPIVTLKWTRVAQPDVLEYHWVRTNPDGSQNEFAVSATKPGGQGCDTNGDEYVCYDDYFPGPNYAGTYYYQLFAMRSSPDAGAPNCALYSSNCIAGDTGSDRSAGVTAPVSPSPTPRKTKGPTPTTHKTSGSGSRVLGGTYSDRPTYCDFYCGKFKRTLPYGQRPLLVAPTSVPRSSSTAQSGADLAFQAPTGAAPKDARRLWQSIAAGLLMVLGAVHISRVLRRA